MKYCMAVVVLLPLALTLACHRIKRYPMQGEVVAKNVATGEITVKHGDIPGFMDAMTMPYRVKNAAVVQEVRPVTRLPLLSSSAAIPVITGWKMSASPMNRDAGEDSPLPGPAC